MRGDLRDPGGERSPAGIAGQVRICANPGFLGYVLGLGVVAYDRPRNTVHACVVAAQQKLKGLRVVVEDLSDDLPVGAVGRNGFGIVHGGGGDAMPVVETVRASSAARPAAF